MEHHLVRSGSPEISGRIVDFVFNEPKSSISVEDLLLLLLMIMVLIRDLSTLENSFNIRAMLGNVGQFA